MFDPCIHRKKVHVFDPCIHRTNVCIRSMYTQKSLHVVFDPCIHRKMCTCCVRSKNTQKNMYMLCSIHVYTQKMHMSTDMFDPCTHTQSTCTPIVSKLNYSVLGVNHAVITGCTSLETSSTEAWLVGLSHAKPS